MIVATQVTVNLLIEDVRSLTERLWDRLYGTRCPYCGMRDREPSTHLARIHDKPSVSA